MIRSVSRSALPRALHSALRFCFLVTGSGGEKAREISVDRRRAQGAGQIRRRIEPGKNCVHDLGARNASLAVAAGNVARPEADVIQPRPPFHAEINDRMTVLRAAYFRGPEDFHEIAGLRLGEVVEVFAEIHFVKETGGAGTVRVPSAPDAFAVALVANKEAVERRVIETKRAARAQDFDGLDEH